jgi:hypothetical protein
MDRKCLINMHPNEVVVSSPCARVFRAIQLRGERLQTENGLDVIFTLRLRKHAPLEWDVSDDSDREKQLTTPS